MKSKIAYLLSKPLRWFHRKGFGVQSPWAFEFVTHVLFCSSRYYIFDELDGKKSDEQLFRIINWLNPSDVVVHTNNTLTKAYIVAPLRKDISRRSDMVVHYYDNSHENDLERDVETRLFTAKSCLIIDGIMNENKVSWENIINSDSATSTFDLGNRGIVFFDPQRQRQNYRI